MEIKIHFPALVISKNSIDKLNYRYLVGDKRYIGTGFRNVLFVDADGNCFDTKTVVQDGRIDFWYSLKLVGLIVRLKPILKQPVYPIDLQNLKEKLTSVVAQHPKRFSDMMDSKSLINEINQSKSMKELFDIF